MNIETLSAVRIYLDRARAPKGERLWHRLFGRTPSLATHLVYEALATTGIVHASIALGHMGFARGAKFVTSEFEDMPLATLPVCVEIVATRAVIEQFVRDRAAVLKGTTILMVESVHVIHCNPEDDPEIQREVEDIIRQ